jgi:hypothetical protein
LVPKRYLIYTLDEFEDKCIHIKFLAPIYDINLSITFRCFLLPYVFTYLKRSLNIISTLLAKLWTYNTLFLPIGYPVGIKNLFILYNEVFTLTTISLFSPSL